MKKILGFLSLAVVLTVMSCNNENKQKEDPQKAEGGNTKTEDAKKTDVIEVPIPVPPPPPPPSKVVIKPPPLPPLPPPPPKPPLPPKPKKPGG